MSKNEAKLGRVKTFSEKMKQKQNEKRERGWGVWLNKTHHDMCAWKHAAGNLQHLHQPNICWLWPNAAPPQLTPGTTPHATGFLHLQRMICSREENERVWCRGGCLGRTLVVQRGCSVRVACENKSGRILTFSSKHSKAWLWYLLIMDCSSADSVTSSWSSGSTLSAVIVNSVSDSCYFWQKRPKKSVIDCPEKCLEHFLWKVWIVFW